MSHFPLRIPLKNVFLFVSISHDIKREYLKKKILEFLPYIDFNHFSLTGTIYICHSISSENQQNVKESVTWDGLY